MKKLTGFSVWGVVAGIAVVIAIAVGAFVVIDGNNKATDFNKYDFYSVIEASADNGGIGDHVKGKADAPVLIFEYADYQCPGCSSMNTRVNKMVEEMDGKVAVVYRSYLLPYHQNGTAAASAAEAAGLQGYWKEYADKLFSEQAEWEYASASERTGFYVDGQWINWSEAGSVTVNGKTITWDAVSANDDFAKIIKRIVEAKSQ